MDLKNDQVSKILAIKASELGSLIKKVDLAPNSGGVDITITMESLSDEIIFSLINLLRSLANNTKKKFETNEPNESNKSVSFSLDDNPSSLNGVTEYDSQFSKFNFLSMALDSTKTGNTNTSSINKSENCIAQKSIDNAIEEVKTQLSKLSIQSDTSFGKDVRGTNQPQINTFDNTFNSNLEESLPKKTESPGPISKSISFSISEDKNISSSVPQDLKFQVCPKLNNNFSNVQLFNNCTDFPIENKYDNSIDSSKYQLYNTRFSDNSIENQIIYSSFSQRDMNKNLTNMSEIYFNPNHNMQSNFDNIKYDSSKDLFSTKMAENLYRNSHTHNEISYFNSNQVTGNNNNNNNISDCFNTIINPINNCNLPNNIFQYNVKKPLLSNDNNNNNIKEYYLSPQQNIHSSLPLTMDLHLLQENTNSNPNYVCQTEVFPKFKRSPTMHLIGDLATEIVSSFTKGIHCNTNDELVLRRAYISYICNIVSRTISRLMLPEYLIPGCTADPTITFIGNECISVMKSYDIFNDKFTYVLPCSLPRDLRISVDTKDKSKKSSQNLISGVRIFSMIYKCCISLNGNDVVQSVLHLLRKMNEYWSHCLPNSKKLVISDDKMKNIEIAIRFLECFN